MSSSSSSGSSAPERLGNVVLCERLARGGMGEVWRGERLSAGGVARRVAVKRIVAALQHDPQYRARFLAEAKITARLEHPNIVQLIDFGDEPELYLVLEYVEGGSLSTVIERAAGQHGAGNAPGWSTAAALFVASEVAAGLDCAHRAVDEAGHALGVVHRDVSPENVLLSREGAVKIGDFGIAHAAAQARLTGAGTVMGKASYMAPEQAAGAELDARADVFALGVVLWEALTLHPLLPRDAPSSALEMLRRGGFPPPSRLAPGGLPPAVDHVVARALALQPAARFQTAGEFGAALRGVLHAFAPGFDAQDLARLIAPLLPARASVPAPPPSPSSGVLPRTRMGEAVAPPMAAHDASSPAAYVLPGVTAPVALPALVPNESLAVAPSHVPPAPAVTPSGGGVAWANGAPNMAAAPVAMPLAPPSYVPPLVAAPSGPPVPPAAPAPLPPTPTSRASWVTIVALGALAWLVFLGVIGAMRNAQNAPLAPLGPDDPTGPTLAARVTSAGRRCARARALELPLGATAVLDATYLPSGTPAALTVRVTGTAIDDALARCVERAMQPVTLPPTPMGAQLHGVTAVF